MHRERGSLRHHEPQEGTDPGTERGIVLLHDQVQQVQRSLTQKAKKNVNAQEYILFMSISGEFITQKDATLRSFTPQFSPFLLSHFFP